MLCLDFYIHVFLVYIYASITAASTTAPPITTTTTTRETAPHTHPLAKAVPQCAFACTEHFLDTEYPLHECPDRSDVACLCRSSSSSGYTLGEGVLRCMLGDCAGDVLRERAGSAYNICEGVEGALRPTHATLTVSSSFPGAGTLTGMTGSSPTETETGWSTSTGTGTGTGAGTGAGPSTHPASPKSQPPSSPITTDSGPTSASTSTSATSTSPSAGPTSTSSPGSSLSPGSVAGVSVASGLSGFFLIALVFFLWRRKQRRSEPDNHYFEIGGVMSEPPDFAFPPRRPTPTVMRVPPLPPPKHPHSPPNRTPDHTPDHTPEGRLHPTVVVTGVDGSDRIGHAISSNLDEDDDYHDHAAGLYPEPLRWDRRPRSDITTFEEDERPLQPEPQPQLQPQPRLPHLYPNFSGLIGPRPYPGRMATGLPAHPRALMYGFPPPTQAGDRSRWPAESDSQSQSQSESSCSGSRSGSGSGSDSESGTRPQPHPQGISRHSGYFTPLPVREARTPSRSENTSPIDYTTSPSLRRPRMLASGTGPSTPTPIPGTDTGTRSEILSRPRIVHQQDVKRVQIKRCKPPRQRRFEQHQQQRQQLPAFQSSRDLNAVPPYSPDDFWYDPAGGHYRSSLSMQSTASGTASGSGSGSGSYPPLTGTTVASAPTPPSMNRLSGSSAVEKSITRKPIRQHQLTPARQGGDLILRVDSSFDPTL